jgi:hypothetical protein
VDPIDLAILALRLATVAVLYGFLVTVMRAAARSLAATPPPVVSPGRLSLVVVEPGGSALPQGHVIEVSDGATLGRSARAAVVVADATVSGEHARIDYIGRTWTVSDLGSTNGTCVNDERVNGESALAPGDVLALGNVRLRVGAR